ncbi:uncharacterized protein LOC110942970 [Helianthus annuus]|uniref:uncharacterized protein LOC110942970 n=1 Tax=Helianthus annuus TaxID=4232 RepID=UPI000B8F1444|nr:uncharacterized protein LOC110942970 [Helianthus annuus]
MEAPGKVHMRLDPTSTAHAEESQIEKSVEKQPTRIRLSPLVDPSRIPYPARLKHQKYAKEHRQFLEMFKQVKINLSFIEALQSMLKGAVTSAHALADLGANINLMPFSLYDRLGLGELTPMRMSLSLADRSVKYPCGIVENLLVKVDKFVFPVDFVILDMEADERVPIILGRPFLRTAKAIIYVF